MVTKEEGYALLKDARYQQAQEQIARLTGTVGHLEQRVSELRAQLTVAEEQKADCQCDALRRQVEELESYEEAQKEEALAAEKRAVQAEEALDEYRAAVRGQILRPTALCRVCGTHSGHAPDCLTPLLQSHHHHHHQPEKLMSTDPEVLAVLTQIAVALEAQVALMRESLPLLAAQKPKEPKAPKPAPALALVPVATAVEVAAPALALVPVATAVEVAAPAPAAKAEPTPVEPKPAAPVAPAKEKVIGLDDVRPHYLRYVTAKGAGKADVGRQAGLTLLGHYGNAKALGEVPTDRLGDLLKYLQIWESEQSGNVPAPAPAAEPPPAAKGDPKPAPVPAAPAKAPTLADKPALLAAAQPAFKALVEKDKPAAVALLARFGAKKLSEVPVASFAELLEAPTLADKPALLAAAQSAFKALVEKDKPGAVALLARFGAKKLSEVPVASFAELLEACGG